MITVLPSQAWHVFEEHLKTCSKCRQFGGVTAPVDVMCQVGRQLEAAWTEAEMEWRRATVVSGDDPQPAVEQVVEMQTIEFWLERPRRSVKMRVALSPDLQTLVVRSVRVLAGDDWKSVPRIKITVLGRGTMDEHDGGE